jgi:long-subunit acyl-CoA synthetase (AMP-forming)
VADFAGVMLSHENLVQETYLTALSGRAWAAKQIEEGKELKPYRTLAHLPISHIAGLFGYLVAPFYSGGLVVWMKRYEWSKLIRYAKEYEITAFYTVPSIYLRISKSPDVKDHFKSVDAATTGAAPMDGELQTSANSKLGAGETYIGQTWGLSETTGAVTMMPKGQSDVTGSISPILPNVELRIVDDNYHDVEPGQEGELLVRSPLVTQGYFNNPQATEEAFHDGWFCTGDIGIMKDGKFYIVDRKKVSDVTCL